MQEKTVLYYCKKQKVPFACEWTGISLSVVHNAGVKEGNG